MYFLGYYKGCSLYMSKNHGFPLIFALILDISGHTPSLCPNKLPNHVTVHSAPFARHLSTLGALQRFLAATQLPLLIKWRSLRQLMHEKPHASMHFHNKS